MRPSLGASPDPYFVDISIPTKEGDLISYFNEYA